MDSGIKIFEKSYYQNKLCLKPKQYENYCFISEITVQSSAVDSGGAGGARATPEFWSSEKG